MVEKAGNGYKIIGEAADGEEAWELINQLWPVILVTDIVMPKKDGLWLVQQIAENHLPIVPIVISGYDNFEYAQKCIKYGVSEYLLKPVDDEQLCRALEQCTGYFSIQNNMHENLINIRNFMDSIHELDEKTLIDGQEKLINEILYSKNLEKIQRKALVSILASKFNELHESINSICDIMDYDSDDNNSIIRFFRVQAELWITRYQNYPGIGNSQTIIKICRYINTHYREDLRLKEIAEYVNLSISRFCAVFKKEMNTTFVNYLNKIRVEKAETLLLNSSMKIYEVAEKSGYISLQYFNRVFKNIKGLSPNEFRKKIGVI